MYHEGKWGGICNTGWNNLAAKVACKTMGYDDGKIIGKQNIFIITLEKLLKKVSY